MFFFVSIAFTYYKQMLDPSFGRKPVPSTTAPSGGADDNYPAFPEHYNPPYLSYDAAPGQYAPPPGPPPAFSQSKDDMDMGYSKGLSDGKGDDPFADFESVGAHGQPGHQVGKVGESREALV